MLLAPSAPPNNLVVLINSTVLNVTWEEPNFEDQNGILQNYIVTFSIVGSLEETVLEVENTQVILSGLQEFTNYTITVNASTVVGVGPGVTASIRTLADGE